MLISMKGLNFWEIFPLFGNLLLVYFYANAETFQRFVGHVREEGEFPLLGLLVLCLWEWLKWGAFVPLGGNGGKTEGLGLGRTGSSRNKQSTGKVRKMWRVVSQFGLACLVCHLFLVLFGAPVLKDFVLTFEFSLVLVCWGLLPYAFSSKNIFDDVVYLRLTESNGWYAQARLMATLMGCVVGTIFLPLDWDRDWQKWPIPCFLSAFVAVSLVDVGAVLHFGVCYLVKFGQSFGASKVKRI